MMSHPQTKRAGLFGPVLILFKADTAHTIHQHRDDGGRKECSDNDQQQFHGPVLTQPRSTPTPAADGRRVSAEMATVRPFLPGKSADLSFQDSHAMLRLSKKEDASWMNSVALHPALRTAAVSAFWSQPLSWCLSCFTRSLQAVLSAPRLIPQQLVQQKKPHQCWKRPHLFNLSPRRQTTSPNSTHHGNCSGGRSDASAFVVSAVRALRMAFACLVTPTIPPTSEACPC